MPGVAADDRRRLHPLDRPTSGHMRPAALERLGVPEFSKDIADIRHGRVKVVRAGAGRGMKAKRNGRVLRAPASPAIASDLSVVVQDHATFLLMGQPRATALRQSAGCRGGPADGPCCVVGLQLWRVR